MSFINTSWLITLPGLLVRTVHESKSSSDTAASCGCSASTSRVSEALSGVGVPQLALQVRDGFHMETHSF